MLPTMKKERKTHPIFCGPNIPSQWIISIRSTCREYHGHFVLFDSRGFPIVRIVGHMVEKARQPIEVYLYNPPDILRRHQHGRCLQLLHPKDLWFKLHWEKPARTFDQARAYVEELMAESMMY